MIRRIESPSLQLAEVDRQVDAASHRAISVVEGLDHENLRHQVEPGSWSVAQCIEHLTITNKAYFPLVNNGLADARTRNDKPTKLYRLDIPGRLLLRFLEPPYRIRARTDPSFEPHTIEPVGEVVPRFLASQAELKVYIRKAEGLLLDQTKIVSPSNHRIGYNLFSTFNIIVTHQRRHLWQAEILRQSLGHST